METREKLVEIKECTSREEIERVMQSEGFGSPSLQEVEQTVKDGNSISATYNANVVFLNPHEFLQFDAETTTELTARIEQAANGREYVARYWAIARLN